MFWGLVVVYYVVASFYFQLYFYNTRLFYAIALFNLVFLFKDKAKKIFSYSIITYLGRNSLWIYLVHYFVIQGLWVRALNFSDNFYLQYFYLFVLGLPLSIVASLSVKYIYDFFAKLFIIKPVE